MPVIKPKSGEKKKQFIPRCIKIMAEKDPKRPHSQRVAMCFTSWRKFRKL